MKLITVYTIVDRLKINGSCARAGIRELLKQGKTRKQISEELGHILRERRSYLANLAEGGDIVPLTADAAVDLTAQIIVPIVAGGDCLGAVSLVSAEEGARIGEGAVQLCRLTADILASQFE